MVHRPAVRTGDSLYWVRVAEDPKLTVVVPTHNGSTRIGALFDGLCRQSLSPERLNVLIVDNGSQPGTAGRIRALDAFQRLQARCHVDLLELPEPGLTQARIAGTLAASSPVVLFLDDDAVPERRACEAALQTFEEAKAGVAFGRVYPRYAVEPHFSIRKREGILAVNHRLGESPLVWKTAGDFAPTLGVALAVRRSAFLEAYPWREPHRLLPDRVGSSLLSGGDMEIGQFLGQAGWWRVYNPQLVVHHVIESRRLAVPAFVRLIVGVERSRASFEDKFSRRPSPARRRLTAARDGVAILALTPALWLARDGYRGWIFALASRWGRLRGAYRSPAAARPPRRSR
jgi:glycosyltransferase involved in cell wall biosynthesis